MVDSISRSAAARTEDGAPQDAKHRILTVATRLFGGQGYEATSIQAIAEEAGIRKQSLLYHYSSKEVLRDAVIDAWLQHWQEELPKLLAKASGYDRFSASVAALLDFFRDEPNRARLALRELLDRPEESRQRMRETLSPWIRLLANYIEMGKQTGHIRPEVQAESYVVQVMLMVVTAVAIGDAVSGLIGEQNEMNVDELIRIAHDALFVNPEKG